MPRANVSPNSRFKVNNGQGFKHQWLAVQKTRLNVLRDAQPAALQLRLGVKGTCHQQQTQD